MLRFISFSQTALLFVLLFLGVRVSSTYAQEAPTQDTLVVQAFTLEQGIAVNWYPTEARFWEAQRNQGYRISRTELDSTGNSLGGEQLLADAVLPQDSAWFAAHGQELNGLMAALGALLYDPAFDFPSNELLDPLKMRFNYLAYEATVHEEAAVALGLGFVDLTAESGKSYRYTVEAVDTTLTGQLEILNRYFSFSQFPIETGFDFSFPNDLSLSDMEARAHPRKDQMIRGTARAYGDSIVLRWGPNTPNLWRSTKYTGYRIFRRTGVQDPVELGSVKPWPKESISEDILPDSMALVASSLLYGGNINQVQEGISRYNQAAVEKNKFGIALYAAERSQLAASILGLRYVDREVDPDSVYSYFVVPDSALPQVDPAAILDVYNVFEPLGAPAGLYIEPGDGNLRLVWSLPNNRNRFNSYTLERSTDGITYESITPQPLVFMGNRRFPLSEYSFEDSVKNNDQMFYYRLRGYNSFGEESEAAEVQGQAVDQTPPRAASITEATFDRDSSRFTISWIPGTVPADFAHYQVLMSEDVDGPYGSVSPPLSADQDSFVLDMRNTDLDRAFFFKIESQDQAGNTSRSIEAQVAVPDLIAPVPPATLTGIVDSLSIVTVAWEHSASKDVRGYWIYWSNDPADEMTPVNTEILTENTFSYAIDRKSLLKKIYYCVRAEDDAYNRGRPSKIIALTRVDDIPPIPPFMAEIASQDTALLAKWEPSASEDVVGQVLYRRTYASPDTTWQLVDTLFSGVKQYVDTALLTDEQYFYRVLAYDQSGNVSEPSNAKSGKLNFPQNKEVVSDIVVNQPEGEDNKGIELTWDYQPKNQQIRNTPYFYEVYRATGNQPLAFVGRADIAAYSDPDIRPNVLYQYAVRVRFDNGWLGSLSQIQSVIVE